MSLDPSVWITGIVVVGIVLVVALWLGRGLSFSKSPDKTSLKIESESADSRSGRVNVAENANFEDVEAGNVTGQKGSSNADVGVMKNASVVRTKMGDITGVDQTKDKDKDD